MSKPDFKPLLDTKELDLKHLGMVDENVLAKALLNAALSSDTLSRAIFKAASCRAALMSNYQEMIKSFGYDVVEARAEFEKMGVLKNER